MQKQIRTVGAEIYKIGNGQTTKKTWKIKSWFFEKINKSERERERKEGKKAGRQEERKGGNHKRSHII